MLSRLIGGLSEGNVQLSQAIIGDVTTETTRAKSLALVGIAFSVCFTFGPSIGAYFASRDLGKPLGIKPAATTTGAVAAGREWNVYALPALISLVLLAVETLYIALRLPETKGFRKQDTSSTKQKTAGSPVAVRESLASRKDRLKRLGRLHGMFLLFFSGAEFTLTFLSKPRRDDP